MLTLTYFWNERTHEVVTDDADLIARMKAALRLNGIGYICSTPTPAQPVQLALAPI